MPDFFLNFLRTKKDNKMNLKNVCRIEVYKTRGLPPYAGSIEIMPGIKNFARKCGRE